MVNLGPSKGCRECRARKLKVKGNCDTCMDACMRSDDMRFSVTDPNLNASVAGGQDLLALVTTYSESNGL